MSLNPSVTGQHIVFARGDINGCEYVWCTECGGVPAVYHRQPEIEGRESGH